MIKRCAIYIRVSTAMQRMEGWSLDAQRAGLIKYAQQRGWKVVGVYADEGKTARKRLKDRREIFRLLEDVKAGQIDIILFKELDRWFRNVSDFYKVQDVLDQYGVTWVSERQPSLEMATKEGRLAVNVQLSVGQNEADSTSERIKYTNKYMREQRRWTAGPQTLPRGFMLDDDQHVIIDPEQEPFIRDLICRFMQSGNLRRSILEANAAYGQNFFYTNARSLLRNPLLCGTYKGVAGFIENPYITREDFDKIQELTAHNIKHNKRHEYVLTGLVKCACCGRTMAGTKAGTSTRKGYPVPCYRCSIGAINELHPANQISEKKLERLLMPYVRDSLAGQIATVTKVQQARKLSKPKSNRAQIEKKLDKLEDLYINSDRMTKEKYEEKKAAILAQLIEDEPEGDLPDVATLEDIQAIFDGGIDEMYNGMTNLEKRAFWREIVNSITVQGGRITDINFKA